MDEVKRVAARVEGRVQGVGYRAFVVHEARRLGLRGWVRNCTDGDVETVAEGPEPKLRELLLALRRGPAASRVQLVSERWSEPSGDFGGFNIAY